jgi:hypothetical protein
MKKGIRYFAWAWIIIIGGLMITPGGIDCIRCGPVLNNILAIVSILAGIAGIYAEVKESSAISKQ